MSSEDIKKKKKKTGKVDAIIIGAAENSCKLYKRKIERHFIGDLRKLLVNELTLVLRRSERKAKITLLESY